MTEATPAAAAPKPKSQDSVDMTVQQCMGKVNKNAGSFAAFFFVLLAGGFLLGAFILNKAASMATEAVLALLVLALVAYYNRTAAVILFLAALAYIVFVFK
ncbi:MAG: hypothetical protein NT067_05830 [Candidatus Diapherotrites archaeon]|nr:hypothetical protein [Candidatus Diapherotrites archaeon]